MRKFNKRKLVSEDQTFEIEVPYKVAVTQTSAQGIVEIEPPYINNIKQFLSNGREATLEAAILSLKKEMFGDLIAQNCLKLKVIDAPIAVSQVINKGEYFYDGNRIIINEEQADLYYIDADGDRGSLFIAPETEGEKAILMKFPIHNRPMILRRSDAWPLENFEDVTNPNKENSNMSEKKYFLKRHTIPAVGLITRAWDRKELSMSIGKSYDEGVRFLLAGDIDEETGRSQRSMDLEDRAMKLVRKDGAESSELFIQPFINSAIYIIPEMAWAFQSRLGSGPTVATVDLKETIAKANALKPVFAQGEPKERKAEINKWRRKFTASGLLKTLFDAGVIKFTKLDEDEDNVLSPVVVTLYNANGKKAALVDTKRENAGERLSYSWVLYPVYDNATLYNEEGVIGFGASEMWLDPIKFLDKKLCEFDNTVRPFTGGPINHYWPRLPSHLWMPRYSIKLAMLQKFLQETLGEYGDCLPVTINGTDEDSPITMSNIAMELVNNTFAIDYGSAMTPEEMWEVANEATTKLKENYGFSLNLAGNKGTNSVVRKYVKANSEGGAYFAPLGCHIGRPGMGRSQLLRSLRKETFKVAVVDMPDSHQVLITPSGIEKQMIKSGYLDRVFTNIEDVEAAKKVYGVEPTEVKYQNFQGVEMICWTFPARKTARLGKLVDTMGNKFMPRQYKKVFTVGKAEQNKAIVRNDMTQGIAIGIYRERKETIDLVIPVSELVAKENFNQFTEGAVEEDIEIQTEEGTRYVKALVVERTFYRTGTESENIPARRRIQAYRGLEKFVIKQIAKENLGLDLEFETVDFEYAEALQQTILALKPDCDMKITY